MSTGRPAAGLGPDDTALAELPLRAAVGVFLAFALGYFGSALVRSVTATLSPVLTTEFDLQAAELGLLAGGYFLGFAGMQLPLGRWLDRHGPRRVELAFLAVAVLACLAFAASDSFAGLLLSRVLVGMGLAACLMAPLTGFRRWYPPGQMLRANSWMLMVGSLGMVASTLPVQWLLPVMGSRPIFWLLALLLLLAMALVAWQAPRWPAPPAGPSDAPEGYGPIVRHPAFVRLVPLALFNYGGMVGLQTLWAGPWLTQVTGLAPAAAAAGLFQLNLAMLLAFWVWGLATPALLRRGWSVERLIAWGTPLSLLVLAANIALGPATGWPGWAAYCVLCTVISLAQPALGMRFAPAQAGRALSAYNLLVFLGVFLMQWGVGWLIDVGRASGWSEPASFQLALAAHGLACLGGYAWFLWHGADNRGP